MLFLFQFIYKITILTLITDEPLKPPSLSSPPLTSHKFIHLILILTLFCFFILYFLSHTPSPSDLDHHFTGLNLIIQ
ncbi:hypothetical protein RYX36_033747, partial [Vicia faba]